MKLYQQFLTRNDCYRAGKALTPAGVMVHSTGVNNPEVSRYVPGDAVLGRNMTGNHWDQSNEEWIKKFGVPLNKCVHAFIGKGADGGVVTVQTLPWDIAGWHAGGSANDGYIGFEICEDGLDDRAYFDAVYREAVELTAFLCRRYDLDPLADSSVICHAEGSRRGIASNHVDVEHWFSRFGMTMDRFRQDVSAELKTDKGADSEISFVEYRRQLQDNDHADWSAQALEWAKARGLFSGAPGKDGLPNYMWEDFVTREQLAVVLYQLTNF